MSKQGELTGHLIDAYVSVK